MDTFKSRILNNICYTELVYGIINKKLKTVESRQEIESFIYNIISETAEQYFMKRGKNIYVANRKNKIVITINSNTWRVITVDALT